MTAAPGRRFIVEADGGSRGNPGPAGYGAVVRDASTHEVLVERAESLGVATNNFAEYHGLLAGLRAARELDPHAWVEARLDSRLVVEQMSGRWQVKHPDLRPLVREAASVAASFGPGHVTYQWVPREQNKHADRLANEAMDAAGSRAAGNPRRPTSSRPAAPAAPAAQVATQAGNRIVGWMPTTTATTLLVVRHGVTAFTLEKRFSGTGDPPLVEQGRLQAKLIAERLVARGGVDLVVSSPLARCRETAATIAGALHAELTVEDDLREVDFGVWEGLTFATVEERWSRELALWLGDTAISPPDGESYEELRLRVVAAQQRLVNRHRGRTLCVVTHSRATAMLVAAALDAATAAIYRLHVDPVSVTELDYYDDGPAVLRTFNDTSHLR